MGALAALSGIILSSRMAAAQPTAGLTYELDDIAGVPTYYQYVIKGLLVIFAVGLDTHLRKKQRR